MDILTIKGGNRFMALKEQVNKKNGPRNEDGMMRDGKPLEQGTIETIKKK
jgi:hypothetical protein